MKINKMWALFYKDGMLCSHLVEPTKAAVIAKANRIFGVKWPEFTEYYGHTIEEIVVLRAADLEAAIKAAEDKRGEEVLKLAIESFKGSHKEGTARSITIENIRQAYQERFGHKQPEV